MAENDDAQPAGEEKRAAPPEQPLDLEALEASIRERLAKVIARAKEVQTAVKRSLSRAAPIRSVRAAALGLLDEKDSRLRPLLAAVRKRSEVSGRVIREVTADLDYQLTLRDELVRGAIAADEQLQALMQAPVDHWSRAVCGLHADLLHRVDTASKWLETTELRWVPAGSEEGKDVPAGKTPGSGDGNR